MKNLPIRQPYFIIWTILYLCFLLLGLILPNSLAVTFLRLAGIFLCVLYVFIYSQNLLLKFAFMLTLLADVFLAINSVSIAGVITFCFVQFTHFIRLKNSSYKLLVIFYIGILLVFVFSILWNIDAHYPLAAIYCTTLVTNIFLAKKRDTISFLGFLLFLCCDILVAVSFLASVGVLHHALHPIADYLAWAFYLPSQVLIANTPEKLARSTKKVAKAR